MTFLTKGPKNTDPASIKALLAHSDPAPSPLDDSLLPNDSAPENSADFPFHLSILHTSAFPPERIQEQNRFAQRHHQLSLSELWLRAGHLDERIYYMTAASRLGIPFIDEPVTPDLVELPSGLPLTEFSEIDAVQIKSNTGGKGLAVWPMTRLLYAPQGHALDRLALAIQSNKDLRHRVCLTSPSTLQAIIRDRASKRAMSEFVFQLRDRFPHLSSHQSAGLSHGLVALVSLFSFLAMGAFWPALSVSVNFLSIAIFLSIAVLRVMALLDTPRLRAIEQKRLLRFDAVRQTLDRWPSYTILVPLYREAAIVGDLISALSKLDYPKECLSIQLLVEVDDAETREALRQCQVPAPFSIVTIPAEGPRTKPKALNYALAFVKSDFVVIFDAEDRPNPMQLKEAALHMLSGGEKLGCLQGRLAIDNAQSNFLTRQFAIEYAALFDGLLPFLAAERLPVPLGGTSNHFRTSVLKKVGGWDPYNVTEDADLGLRLTRLGYRIETLMCETWEEAPERYDMWLKQRTRWFKGWMQTWLVHMRSPAILLQDLGRSGFLAFQVLIGGMLVSALIHPLYIASILTTLVAIAFELWIDSPLFWFLVVANGFNLMVGYGGTMLLARYTAGRRHHYGWRYVLEMPIYWLLMTPAAWRAAFQLFTSPHKWEKTPHGVSKTRPSL